MASPDQAVEAMQRAYASAVDAKDADAFLSLYDSTARVFDAWAVWSFESRDGRAPSIREWLGTLASNERVRVTFDDTRLIGTGEFITATAFVTYAAIDLDERVLRSMQNRLTWTLRIVNDRATILHEHTSVPIDDQFRGMLTRG